MLTVLRSSWALLAGIMLLMLGNGIQGTLIGIRGNIEGFSATTMSWVMAAYFAGFLVGSRAAPWMIKRVGHVRVFAALGSLTSALFILFPVLPDPIAWSLMRFGVGICFSGIYVVAESWLNNSATNETRGQALSLYVIVQMVGIVVAQSIISLADPAGWTLFVLMSVAVSVAFLPILLDVSPAPMFETTKPMSLSELYQVSPLGMVGIFFLGTIFSALFGMGSVYGTERGLSVTDISIFMGAIFVGGMILQYPIGWVSDRMDRRRLIIGITGLGAISMVLGGFMTESRWVVFGLAFLAGGLANPLYSLLIAYTNDFLEHEDMAAASGGLIFANGVGAVSGPFLVGLVMNAFGADSYFLFI
ncbi:MAG: MFS transporter, partial [Pseudomonadota bacterium]